MARDGTYKPEGATIVTVPLDPALHRRLRIHAVSGGGTIKSVVTRLIEKHLAEQSQATLAPYVPDGSGCVINAIREALEWTLAELDGRTKYETDEQRENCFDLARRALDALAANAPDATP